MSKKIVIENCGACPHKDHKGAYGRVSYIPCCTKVHGKILPYTEHASRGNVYAHDTGVIPDWCPLEEND